MGKRRDIVVITGASAGVGRATAEAFARQGARIGLIARGAERLEEARCAVLALGGEAVMVRTDVADFDQVEAAARVVEEWLGPIDVWVNNAMSTIFSPGFSVTPEEFRRATDVTYLGTVWGTLVALRRMMPRNRGVVVQVGSALAYRSIPLQAPYCGAKHAVKGFTDSLRCELLHVRSRVHLTMVQLPAMNTPQFEWCRSRLPRHPQPVPPIFQPEVAAEAIVWAVRKRRREVFVGGPTVKAIEANKLAPSLLDRYLARTGYRSQQMQEPLPSERPGNLFEPVSGSYAAHGRFDSKSRSRSAQLWATRHRAALIAGGVGMIALLIALLFG